MLLLDALCRTAYRLWILSLILLALWLYPGQIVLAEEAAAPPVTELEPIAPNRSAFDADAISPEKVGQFVQAYLQVITLIERRGGELQEAETETESARIQQAIEAEALELIEAEGLNLQEYLQLLSLANIDPEFGDRIAVQLQEAIH